MEELSKVIDVFFNGRAASPVDAREVKGHIRAQLILELAARRTSIVKVGKQKFKVTAEPYKERP